MNTRLVLAMAACAGSIEAADIGWDALLSSHGADHSLVAARERVKELGQGQLVQLWEDLEVRYDAKRADLRKQEVGLRISPSGFGEIGANRALWTARREVGDLKLRQMESEAIFDRYGLALDWRFQERQRRYHLEMKEICERRLEVLAKLAADPKFNPEYLVEAQIGRTEYLAKAEGDLYQMSQAERKMRQYLPGTGAVRLEGELLTRQEVERFLAGIDPAKADSFPRVKLAQGQLALEQAKTDQEVAASRRWLGYLEAGYTFDVDENRLELQTQRDNISFGFGIKIPLFDGSSQNIARRRAELAQARLNFQDDREDVERKVGDLRLSIGSLLRQTAVLDSFAARVDAGRLFTDYAVRSGSDPLLLLKAKQTSIESAWRIEELHFAILRQYIELLHLSGSLVARPEVNHLLSKYPPVSAAGRLEGGS